MCTCASACQGGVCDRQKEKAGAAPSWAPPGNNWFHSFMPSLLTSISSVSSGRVPGPALGAGASLGPGTHPFLPWRNSQSREEPDQEKQPSPAESGFGGKDTGFGRNAVAGSCAPSHETGPRQPKSCHSARRERCNWLESGGRGRRGAAPGRLPGPESARGTRWACGRRRPGDLQGALARPGEGQGYPAGAAVGAAPILR